MSAISRDLTNRTLAISHEIAGEAFDIKQDDSGSITLLHPTWSLIGEGSSLLEAEQDLLSEAIELADLYLDFPLESLDYEALRLRNFLLRIIS